SVGLGGAAGTVCGPRASRPLVWSVGGGRGRGDGHPAPGYQRGGQAIGPGDRLGPPAGHRPPATEEALGLRTSTAIVGRVILDGEPRESLGGGIEGARG